MPVHQDKGPTSHETVMRFGVFRALHFGITEDGDWERWNNPGQPAILEYHPVRPKPGVPLPPDVRGRLMLIDTEVTE